MARRLLWLRGDLAANVMIAAVLGLLSVGVVACGDSGGGSGPGEDTTVDTAEDDTALADTADEPDTATDTSIDDTASDDVGPDVASDTAVPADTSVAPDTTNVPDGSFPLACAGNGDCSVGCANGVCTAGRCSFPAPQAGCVVIDEATASGTCVDAGAASPDAACRTCQPDVFAEGYGPDLFRESFDTSAGLAIQTVGVSSASWSLSTVRAYDGTRSLYFGDPELMSYDVGGRASAVATTRAIAVPEGAPVTLNFELYLDTEETADFDYLRVLVDQGGDALPVEVWHSNAINGTTFGTFLPIRVSLDDVATAGMRIMFEFDSVDGIINGFEGAYIDAITVTTGCCVIDTECDDGNACTVDTCGAGGTCEFAPAGDCCLTAADCDDGDACTRNECPVAGEACVHPAIFGCCHDLSDCDDDDPCTEDACPADGAMCTHQPLCCDSNADCDDEDECTVGVCEAGQCSYTFACCEDETDCDDGDACTNETCAPTGLCQYEFQAIAGCCQPDVLTERFDTGAPGWTFTALTANVGWRRQTTPDASSGTSVLYYGHPTLSYYQTSGANSGRARSPIFRLPDDAEASVEFNVWIEVEPDLNRDKFSVVAILGSTEVVLLDKSNLNLTTPGWQAVSLNVSYLAGQNIRLAFDFDTVDGVANNSRGVLIDDVRVLSSCQARACQSDAGCTSAASCITGTCVSGGCSYAGICP